MVRAIMDAFFTSNPRRQTDRRIPGRTWAGVSGQPAPSRICRICTAEHRPVLVCRIQRKTSFVHRTAATRPAVCLRFRLFGAAFRAEFSACRRAALRTIPAFGGRLWFRLFTATVRQNFPVYRSVHTNSSILQQLPEPEQAALLAAVRPSDRDSARSCRPPDLPCSCP